MGKVFILTFILIFCHRKEINLYNNKGQKVGYWEYQLTDSTFESGYYEDDFKSGEWKYFKNKKLVREDFHSLSDDSIKIEQRKYYHDGLHYLSEKVVDSQIVDIDVLDDSLYRKIYLSTNPIRLLGSDLFIYNCFGSGCHGGYPFVRSEIDIDKYSNIDTLHQFIIKTNHEKLVDSTFNKLDMTELEAIIEYINPDYSYTN